jgi:hypothetical protein
MATQHLTAPGRRRRVPFGTLLLITAVAIGLAAGIQALRAPANTSAAVAVPATVVGTSGDANRVATPVSTPVVASEACTAMDAAGYRTYCGPVSGIKATPPRVTWQACAAMDITAYRMSCSPGDGGRWVPRS